MHLLNRKFCLFTTLLFMSLAGVGCAAKKPGTGAQAGAPPPTLNLTLEAAVPALPSVSWLSHDAVRITKKPGDTVGFTAKANVPEGHRLVVDLLDTSWEIPLSTSAGGNTFTGSAAIPDLPMPARSYQPEARILDAQGQQVASATADELLFIDPGRGLCHGLQADLERIRVPFDYDEYSLTEAAKQAMTAAIKQIKDSGLSALGFEIEGHCDERGTNEYNISLSDKRAGVVRDYLVTVGVADRANTKVIPYGEERPRNPGHDEQAWSENRRAEIKVSCPMD